MQAGHPPRAAVAPPPAVAVVVPCFNQGRFLPEALASVRVQSHPAVTCLVVDDGSTDSDTLGVLHELEHEGLTVLRQSNQGLAAARNAGVRASRAEFFVPLDADDRLHPRFIEALLPPLLADRSLGFAYCHVRYFGAESRTWKCRPYDPERLVFQNLGAATALVRREAFESVGGYGTDMTEGYEDWDFWLALLNAGWRGALVPRPLFFYRRHAGGDSMLDRLKRRPQNMLRCMIAHHRSLVTRYLLGQEREAARDAVSDDDLLRELDARTQLDYIESSSLWRLVRTLAVGPAASWLGLARVVARQRPSVRLAQIQASRAYRLIQAVKRTTPLRWYARLRHGPGAGPPPRVSDA
jgi:glycosyltransferase involved in cell wall biosynthesis